MDKKQVAHVLRDIGVLLELTGENPFKVRAYVNAARTIEMLEGDIETLVAAGDLRSVKGIGSALAEKITTLVTTGELPYYETLKQQVPPGLLDMLRIPGLGPKKISALYATLSISDIAELEYACKENRLVALKGFGRKTQERILQGLEHIRKFQGQFLAGVVLPTAEELRLQLSRSAAVADVQIAGSLRRRKELVKDIDLVASSQEPRAVMHSFVELPGVAEVVSSGDTKTSVVCTSGINADLRVVSPEQFPFALHHFTGSREHNTAMRQRAKSLGLKMNEYGLFRGQESVQADNEAELFAQLGLSYIPPELRENTGEIEAAARDELPVLVTRDDIQGAFHVHTTYSDGAADLQDMVAEAQKAGFAYIGVADHSRSASYAGGLSVDAVKRQHDEIAALNASQSEVYVFHGIESDILPDGSLDYPDDILALFDFVIASVHSHFSLTGRQATERLVTAMRHPSVTMLGHPTGRLLLGRAGYEPHMETLLEAAREFGVIMELNANPQRFDIDWRHLRSARDQGVLISINPDAHRREGLYDTYLGVGPARKGWLGPDSVFNSRPLEKVKAYFENKKRTQHRRR